MIKKALAVLIVLISCSLTAPAQEQSADQIAYTELTKELDAIDDPGRRLELLVSFIDTYPNSPRIYYPLRLIRDNVLAIDGDTDRAIDIVEAFLPRIEDLRVRNGAKVVLLNFYSDSNRKEKFRPLAEEVLKAFSGSTSDYNHRNFAVLADGCGEYEFALKLNGVAEEAYRKDFEQKTDRAKE